MTATIVRTPSRPPPAPEKAFYVVYYDRDTRTNSKPVAHAGDPGSLGRMLGDVLTLMREGYDVYIVRHPIPPRDELEPEHAQ
jgi:hypothetical protein